MNFVSEYLYTLLTNGCECVWVVFLSMQTVGLLQLKKIIGKVKRQQKKSERDENMTDLQKTEGAQDF